MFYFWHPTIIKRLIVLNNCSRNIFCTCIYLVLWHTKPQWCWRVWNRQARVELQNTGVSVGGGSGSCQLPPQTVIQALAPVIVCCYYEYLNTLEYPDSELTSCICRRGQDGHQHRGAPAAAGQEGCADPRAGGGEHDAQVPARQVPLSLPAWRW